MSKLDQQTALGMHRTMCRIRYFEEAAAAKYKEGELPGFIHLSIGQEACAAGVCATLEVSDYITSTHRGHGHCIAKGVPVNEMMAEIRGKATGCCKGKGGSMHIADVDKGMLGANGIVGAFNDESYAPMDKGGHGILLFMITPERPIRIPSTASNWAR